MGKEGKVRRCGEGREGTEVWGRMGRYGGVGKEGKVRRCGEGREGTDCYKHPETTDDYAIKSSYP